MKEIHEELVEKHNVDGLPRGLSISPTLAELFLERFDAKIALHPDVLYRARYVDDIVIFTTSIKNDKVKSDIDTLLNKMGLSLNDDKAKSYSGSTEGAAFDYLGYSFRVTPIKKGPNQVVVTISNAKLNKIKTRVVKSFSDYKKHNNISLLKRRLEYLSMLKTVKKGKNGHLLAGIAYNYRFVTDEFECLKPIDRFIRHQLNDPRFGIISPNKEIIFKVSFYSNVIKKIIGSFTKTQTNQIMRIWKNV